MSYREIFDLNIQRLRRCANGRAPYVADDMNLAAYFDKTAYEVDTFHYVAMHLWRANRHYRDTYRTRAYYPGLPSIYGSDSDGIEGVSRLMPLWAAWATSGFGVDSAVSDEILDDISRTVLTGTDPGAAGYWGDITDRSTLICEGADIALALWLAREEVWLPMQASSKQRVLRWLKQALGKRTADNNWHLFVILIDAIVSELDGSHRFGSQDRLLAIEKMYVGDGCFTDGPGGRIDYYNAWAFHYALFWLRQIKPSIATELMGEAMHEYVSWFQLLFTNSGFPLFGRSLCYRYALPVPLLALAVENAGVGADVALESLKRTFAFFVAHGGFSQGRPTQGVFRDDIRWLDPYSGPASSMWGMRSLVLFYYGARRIDWTEVLSTRLPVYVSDKTVALERANMRIVTDSVKGRSLVEVCRSKRSEIPRYPGFTMRDRLREVLFARASRPSYNLLDYGVCMFDSSLEIYRK